ncbi:MAG: isopentenyldiphosphate isomerase [Candidatus Taylorbacteria bacterium]|nr:isopentenyldiphosphate isomerase [Candidatus Taylorbacteria bacterium]
MSEQLEMLEVVDGLDNMIGLETRKKIHKDGLLHREIHIFFITPKGEIIFQHRAKDKDTYPDKLDATVAGHVEPNMSYEETAIKETKEETGLDINSKDLIVLEKMNLREVDEATGLINNTVRVQYAYLYKGLVEDLIVEEGKAIGFEPWNMDTLFTLSNKDKNRFKPIVISNRFLLLFKKAKDLI